MAVVICIVIQRLRLESGAGDEERSSSSRRSTSGSRRRSSRKVFGDLFSIPQSKPASMYERLLHCCGLWRFLVVEGPRAERFTGAVVVARSDGGARSTGSSLCAQSLEFLLYVGLTFD